MRAKRGGCLNAGQNKPELTMSSKKPVSRAWYCYEKVLDVF